MSELRRLGQRLQAFFSRKALDAELDAELTTHLEFATEDYVRQGLTPAEARRMALVRFGGVEQAREAQREARGLMQIDILLQDFRYTLRKLMRDPGFTAIAVVILALGIGANVAVFSVVNTLMLRPLPFPNADQLLWIAPPPEKCGLSCATYSTDAYDTFRASSRSYQDVTGYFAFSSPGNLNVQVGSGAPVPATGIDVMENFLNVLGVQPQLGRTFNAGDARNGAAPVVLLTDAWWRRQFHADPSILGKAFHINGQPTTVVGVLPAGFDFSSVFAPGTKVDALTPLQLHGDAKGWGNIVTLIGRTKPGVTLAQAVEDAARVSPSMCWSNKQPASCGNYKGRVVPIPLGNYVTGRLRESLTLLWWAVAIILLIACVNLSNLLLARAAARTKEFAMRRSLGAGRGRIVRQLLTESLVLSVAGAALGLLLAAVVIAWLRSQGAIALPLLGQLRIDGEAVAWTVLVGGLAAMLFGLVPGMRIAAGNLHEALKDTGAGSGQSRKHERLRSVLVVSEVALACMLLVGAGLLLRSFMKVLEIDLGFQPERAAAVTVDYNDDPAIADSHLPDVRNRVLSARGAHFQTLLGQISALPGVEATGITDFLPLTGNRSWGVPFPKGVARPADLRVPEPLVYVISPGYLRAMGTAVRGRDFSWDDRADKRNVVIIDQGYARFLAAYAHWRNDDPIGQILDDGSKDGLLVAGVAEDVHAESVEGENGWQIYYPWTQAKGGTPQLVVRTTLPPAQLASSVMHVLREANPNQPAAEFKPIAMLVQRATSPRRFFMLLVLTFAGLGLLLAALGIYGVISYSVTRQTQELGLRIALGARAGQVQTMVLMSTLRLAIVGVLIGAAASIGTARLVSSLLYATSPWDAATYLAMAVTLLVVAGLAGFLPALRASRISPMVALRTE